MAMMLAACGVSLAGGLSGEVHIPGDFIVARRPIRDHSLSQCRLRLSLTVPSSLLFSFTRACYSSGLNMSVTLHTNLGDVKIEVFCESVPKTAEVSVSLLGKITKANVSEELSCSLHQWLL